MGQRHPGRALLLAIAAVLTAGLALHGVTSQPSQPAQVPPDRPGVVVYVPLTGLDG
jgi:hypothetical protein